MGSEGGGGGNGDGEKPPNEREEESRIRIYVGGLGGSVNADDLRKTFSSSQLGMVESVEIVRTKGRSFAYLDFVPSSDKGLSKLFSKYNGCMWRGGKLRLEKAKEHYAIRLRNEWAENDAIASKPQLNDEGNRETSASENRMKPSDLEKVYLQVFFPKLKKIKRIPFKGTGKHKYSFQHIGVPTVPSHFCDCEEHSVPSQTAFRETFRDLENESVGMNNEELHMINVVLSKVLAKENSSLAVHGTAQVDTGSYDLTNSNDHVHINGAGEDKVSDDDNLIINVVAGPNSRISFSDIRYHNTSTAKKDSQASKKVPSNKKRKAPVCEDGDVHDLRSVSSERRKGVPRKSDKLEIVPLPHASQPGSGSLKLDQNAERPISTWRHIKSNDASFHISDITENNALGAGLHANTDTDTSHSSVIKENKKTKSSKEKEGNKAAGAVVDTPEVAAVKHNTWLQKSTWTQLVGEPSNSSFCISQILPGLEAEKQELPKMKIVDEPRILDHELHHSRTGNSDGGGDVSLSQVKRNDDSPMINKTNFNLAHSKQHPSGCLDDQPPLMTVVESGSLDKEASSATLDKRNPSQLQQGSRKRMSVDPCAFVRNAASMKEWKTAKEAFCRSLKKKREEK